MAVAIDTISTNLVRFLENLVRFLEPLKGRFVHLSETTANNHWERLPSTTASSPRTQATITTHATERTIGPRNSPTIP
jgi:hypothetical protein